MRGRKEILKGVNVQIATGQGIDTGSYNREYQYDNQYINQL